MCKICGHKMGSTRHLLHWQWVWAKRFMRTWYHIFNRRAYRRWATNRSWYKEPIVFTHAFDKSFEDAFGGGPGLWGD